MRDAAARLLKAGDWQNAGALYHAVLDEAVRHYDDELQMMDEDGDIAVLIDEFAEGLGECLKKGEADDTTRRAWLEAYRAAIAGDCSLKPALRLKRISEIVMRVRISRCQRQRPGEQALGGLIVAAPTGGNA